MGNNNSGIVCCVAPAHDEIHEGDKFVMGKSSASTAKTSIGSSKKEESVQRGYSFSSISSKSSTNSNEPKDTYYQPDEMRNDDPEWPDPYHDEIRVAVSSYDEARTEAVNYYYGDSRYGIRIRDLTEEIRDQ